MKNIKIHSMILVALMVIMAISIPLIAGEGNRRDARDLSYMNADPVVMTSSQVASSSDNRRDARDLGYLNSVDVTQVSDQLIAVQGNRRDAKDLAHMSGPTNEAIFDMGNKILCCQR